MSSPFTPADIGMANPHLPRQAGTNSSRRGRDSTDPMQTGAGRVDVGESHPGCSVVAAGADERREHEGRLIAGPESGGCLVEAVHSDVPGEFYNTMDEQDLVTHQDAAGLGGVIRCARGAKDRAAH